MSPAGPQSPQPEESDALSSRLTDTVSQLWNGTQAGTIVRNKENGGTEILSHRCPEDRRK